MEHCTCYACRVTLAAGYSVQTTPADRSGASVMGRPPDAADLHRETASLCMRAVGQYMRDHSRVVLKMVQKSR